MVSIPKVRTNTGGHALADGVRRACRGRAALLSALVLPLTVAWAPQSLAQQTASNEAIEEVITTGTRAKARSVTESPAPIDVISGADFVNQAVP